LLSGFIRRVMVANKYQSYKQLVPMRWARFNLRKNGIAK
jgi:hypothetical protein